jgi:putative hemolysin
MRKAIDAVAAADRLRNERRDGRNARDAEVIVKLSSPDFIIHLVPAILPQNSGQNSPVVLPFTPLPIAKKVIAKKTLSAANRLHFPEERQVKHPLVMLMIVISSAVAVAVFLPVAAPVQAGAPTNQTPAVAVDLSQAADYCAQQGGEVQTREPYFNTNDAEQNWLRLSGGRSFCKFKSHDGSRIYVLLYTLYTDKPSLAALAYYAKVPFDGTGCQGSPASCYCSQLGGTDLFGGINMNGGGWVLKSDPDDPALDTCIFPDMSTIDSWGLAYHQAGIIRGKNLEKVLKFPNPYGK